MPIGSFMIPRKRGRPRRTNQDRDPQYRAFLRESGLCVVCPHESIAEIHARHNRECDPCHTENGGIGMKGPDSGCAPLCRFHHDQYDGRRKLPNGGVGKLAFEAYYRIDMKAAAARWHQYYMKQNK